MKFETTASFDGDFARLLEGEKQLFVEALKSFVPACDRYANDSTAEWPVSLRVRDVHGAPGVWEMTWSFSARWRRMSD